MLCQIKTWINSFTTIKWSGVLLSWCLRCIISRKRWKTDVKTTQKWNSVKDICFGMCLQRQKAGGWHCCRALSTQQAVSSLSGRSNISSDSMTAWAWGQTSTRQTPSGLSLHLSFHLWHGMFLIAVDLM